MSTGFFDPTWRSPSLGRAASVFVLVLLLHLWALYVFSRGLSALVPADATQTTLSVFLLAPPPAPAPTAEAKKPAPRPRARNAPTITPTVAPTAAPAPPVEPAPPDVPPEPPKVAADPPASAPTAEASTLPLGAQALPTKGRIVYRTSYTRLAGLTALTYVDWSIDRDKATYELWLRTV